jgi:REP element-mobilizing transposase RayT
VPTFPIAYHITWGTHGSRLHGSEKPHVDRAHNIYGTPFPSTDQSREELVRGRMVQPPVSLSLEHRKTVLQAIAPLCARYEWRLHEATCQADHAHVVISAPREGKRLRDALKAVASKHLNQRFGQRSWWAEGCSSKYIWDDGYMQRAIEYVRRQRDF